MWVGVVIFIQIVFVVVAAQGYFYIMFQLFVYVYCGCWGLKLLVLVNQDSYLLSSCLLLNYACIYTCKIPKGYENKKFGL